MLVLSVASWVIVSTSLFMILQQSLFISNRDHLNITIYFSLVLIEISIKQGVAFFRLSVKYTLTSGYYKRAPNMTYRNA